MGKHGKTDAGEYEFTRAAYDELRDAEKRYQVEFSLQLIPTTQKGVWALSVAARALGEHEAIAYCARYQGSWPNSTATSYGAFMYQCCHRVCRMVEAWHAQREVDESAPVSGG
jgi:hypothetical protein